jgi:small-conductance mechanosensitive channel
LNAGFTRRFQPEKAATIGQAAIALASGESAEIFSEELARFEAQRMADEAVAADEAAEEQKQKELNALFDGQLTTERQLKEQAQKMFEELKAELEKMKEERDSEMDVLWKDKAAVEAERELLQHIRQQVAEQLQALSTRVMQVSIEQEKLEKLRFNYEDEEAELSRLKSEAEIEKQAFLQARLWAEDEARRAQSLAESLETTRTRMSANQTNKGTIFANKPWMKARTGLEEFLQRAPSPRDLLHKDNWGFLSRSEVEDPALLSCYLVIHWEPSSGFSILCKSKASRLANYAITVFNQYGEWDQEIRQ